MEASFQSLLNEAVKFHGHLCGGQIIGVRMAMAGLRELGISEPKSEQGRDLVIFMEIDRCAADAIISVTGRTPGKRSIKMMDYGKMAATFVDTSSGRSVRVSVRADSEERVKRMAQHLFPQDDEAKAQLDAMACIAEEDLFRIRRVHVAMRPEDLPGVPLDTAVCERCGEMVRDRRQVCLNGSVLCKPCAQGRDYYTLV
ncbi:MAG: FmdE family protein [Desulfobacteraceae bacterium]|nr:FmdE family protein [Desulfobacteraceae bacterium]